MVSSPLLDQPQGLACRTDDLFRQRLRVQGVQFSFSILFFISLYFPSKYACFRPLKCSRKISRVRAADRASPSGFAVRKATAHVRTRVLIESVPAEVALAS